MFSRITMTEEEDFRTENLKMEHLKTELTRDVNNFHLPVGPAYYVVKDILKELEILYNQEVQKEYQQFCEKTAAAQEEVSEVKDKESAVAADNHIEEKKEEE